MALDCPMHFLRSVPLIQRPGRETGYLSTVAALFQMCSSLFWMSRAAHFSTLWKGQIDHSFQIQRLCSSTKNYTLHECTGPCLYRSDRGEKKRRLIQEREMHHLTFSEGRWLMLTGKNFHVHIVFWDEICQNQ